MDKAINDSLRKVKEKFDGYLLSDNKGFPITCNNLVMLLIYIENKIPGDISGFVKSIIDNSKDLEKTCYNEDYGEEVCKDPVIVIETD